MPWRLRRLALVGARGICRVRGSGDRERLPFPDPRPLETLVPTAFRQTRLHGYYSKQASEEETNPQRVLDSLGYTPSPRLPWRWAGAFSEETAASGAPSSQALPRKLRTHPQAHISCGLGVDMRT